MRYLRIRNWDKFQHYKDRNPPWIKLHNNMLENAEFAVLPDDTKGHLICLWLLASRTDNQLPSDRQFLKNRINATKPVNLELLLERGFLEPCPVAPEGNASEWPSRYISDELRAQIMDRDGSQCRKCGSTQGLEIDHIIPVSKGGHSTETNLQVLCRPCNRQKRACVAGATQKKNCVPRGETETETETEPPKPPEGAVGRIFDHWRTTHAHPDAKLTSKRRRCVQARLKEGYSEERLLLAIEGCKASAFHQGQNEAGKVYDDLTLICRDGEHVERFESERRQHLGQRSERLLCRVLTDEEAEQRYAERGLGHLAGEAAPGQGYPGPGPGSAAGDPAQGSAVEGGSGDAAGSEPPEAA